jgi:hypothetical protein
MKFILTIILALSFSNAFGQGEIGIGIVSIEIGQTPTIRFYESHQFETEIKKVELFQDESIKSINIKNLESHRDWLNPESLWLDYGQFRFRCKAKNADCFEVYVSDSKTLWIEKHDYTEFTNWETYLKNMFKVELMDTGKQKIYSRPSDKSEIIEWQNNCFVVKQVQNEWIKIETAEHCESSKKISGWTKWRTDNKILINYFTTS